MINVFLTLQQRLQEDRNINILLIYQNTAITIHVVSFSPKWKKNKVNKKVSYEKFLYPPWLHNAMTETDLFVPFPIFKRFCKLLKGNG